MPVCNRYDHAPFGLNTQGLRPQQTIFLLGERSA